MHRIRKWALHWGSAVMLCGCSVASFKAPIDNYADSTNKATTAAASSVSTIIQDESSEIETKLADPTTHWTLVHDPSDCQDNSTSCRLKAGPAPNFNQQLPPDPPIDIDPITTPLNNYAKALQDIVNADAASKIDASEASAVASLKDVSDTIDKIHTNTVAKVQAEKDAADKAGDTTGSQKYQEMLDKLSKSPAEGQAQQFSAFVSPVGDAFSWLVGQYIAAKQLTALRRVTAKNQPTIRKAGIILDQLMSVLTVDARTDAADTVSIAESKWRQHRTDENAIAQYEAAAIAFNKTLAGIGSGVFLDMVKAHDQLTAEIAQGSVSNDDALASLQTFANQAQGFLKAVSEIQSASAQLRAARQKSQ